MLQACLQQNPDTAMRVSNCRVDERRQQAILPMSAPDEPTPIVSGKKIQLRTAKRSMGH
jgi:hypothetical protein